MSKLITAKDIIECSEAGKSICYIEPKTIVTPAAIDEAKKRGIEISECSGRCESSKETNEHGITSDEILCLLKKMLAGNETDEETVPLPYRCVKHPNGMKVVKGSTVRLDNFDTGNPKAKVEYQELVHKEESKMSAGFLTIDHSSFAWDLPYEEIDYVISGTVSVQIDGQIYVAREGDVIYVPSGSSVVWGSPDKAKIFYTTFPSNWPDLM